MLDIIHSIIKEMRFCVLATVFGKKPYCSLMSYTTNMECSEIYLTTLKNTSKYRNLELNPWVSLLIDTRENIYKDSASGIKSLTIGGELREINSPEEESEIRSLLLDRHPDLSVLLDDRESVILIITIKSYLLLDGLNKTYFIQLNDINRQ